MKEAYCTNFNTCKFVNNDIASQENDKKVEYLLKFCKNDLGNWKNCRRYQVKTELGFCPDFLLPESNLTIDEIIDIIDQNLN